MRLNRLFSGGFFIVSLMMAFEAQAQSFDCSRAGLNLTEHTICQSTDLSQKDSELDRLWNLFNSHDQ